MDMHVHRGEIVLLEGPNGCGKTSLLRHLAGLPAPHPPEAVRRAPAQMLTQEARDGLVGLTVAGEFRLRRLPAPPLGHLLGETVATLSSGEARRVALEVAAAAHPPLLLLDEPAEGLDKRGRQALAAAVRSAAASGAAVVLADHSGTLAELATRRVRLAADDTADVAPLPPVHGRPVVTAPHATVTRGRARLRLPAVALGPGFHVVTGPNGSGKTTLLERLAGLEDAEGARIDGAAPVPGRVARLLLPHARDQLVRATVAEELRGATGPATHLVPATLGPRHPLTLSGGEAQRVALAKTLGHDARLYLLDEPDAHLDRGAWPALRDALAHRVEEGACILAATHDQRLGALAHSTVRLEAP